MAGVAEKFLFLLLFMSSSASGQFYIFDDEMVLSSCPEGWRNINNQCMRYFADAVSWASAESHCTNLSAHLVSIHSESEHMMVKAFIRAYDHRESMTWLGLHDCHQKNYWFWTDGTKYDYSKWNPNEPNHLDGECCAHINQGTSKNWNDVSCDRKYPFVCARKVH